MKPAEQKLSDTYHFKQVNLDVKVREAGVLEEITQHLEILQKIIPFPLGAKKFNLQVSAYQGKAAGKCRSDGTIVLYWQPGSLSRYLFVLGHEWVHAVDYHLQQIAGSKGQVLPFSERRPGNHKLVQLEKLLQMLNSSALAQRARVLDAGGRTYFSLNAELLARSFEDFLGQASGLLRNNVLPEAAYLEVSQLARNSQLWQKALQEIKAMIKQD